MTLGLLPLSHQRLDTDFLAATGGTDLRWGSRMGGMGIRPVDPEARRESLVALSPIALLIITGAALWEARRAAQAASVSADHAAKAAEATRRQADAMERADAVRTLPVVVCASRTFNPADFSDHARMHFRFDNVGRGTAFNVRYRIDRAGSTTLNRDWISGPPAVPVAAKVEHNYADWPDPHATEADFDYTIDVRYGDEDGREYWASTSPRGVTVQRVVPNEDGTFAVSAPLVSYQGAFDF